MLDVPRPSQIVSSFCLVKVGSWDIVSLLKAMEYLKTWSSRGGKRVSRNPLRARTGLFSFRSARAARHRYFGKKPSPHPGISAAAPFQGITLVFSADPIEDRFFLYSNYSEFRECQAP